MKKTPEEILEHRRSLDRERQKRMYYKKKLLKEGAKIVEDKPKQNKDVICIKIPKTEQKQEPKKAAKARTRSDSNKITLDDTINKINEMNKPPDNKAKSRTAAKYIEDVKRLHYITNFNDLIELLNQNPDNVIKQIKEAKQKIKTNETFSNNTLLGIIQIINNLIKYFNIKLPEDTLNRYNHEWEILQATDKITRDKKRTDKDFSVMKFSNFIKLLENKEMEKTKLYTMARLYQEVPVRDDLVLKLIDKSNDIKKNINYLILDSKMTPYKVLIQYSKGSKSKGTTHEPVIIKLSKDTVRVIQKYMNNNNLTKGDEIFKTWTGKNTDYISRAMANIGLKGGFTEWRKMIIADLNKYDVDERVKLSKIMGHSLQMQQGYERKEK